eukprot:TRINITY_DN12572_c0_g1_i1.p1 TRINITY_DN12572_c0_g1~~TRINITY_DN12572_c0_g1_i1.p1  ORF type:complete len:1550 (-),score=220.66 TRINITY_DN12572_c0_g1_i1:94-4743(-)
MGRQAAISRGCAPASLSNADQRPARSHGGVRSPAEARLEKCMICLSSRRCAHVRQHACRGGSQLCGPSPVCMPCTERIVEQFHGGTEGGSGQFVCPICFASLGPRRRALVEGSDAFRWTCVPDTPLHKLNVLPEHPMQVALRHRNVADLRRLANELAIAEDPAKLADSAAIAAQCGASVLSGVSIAAGTQSDENAVNKAAIVEGKNGDFGCETPAKMAKERAIRVAETFAESKPPLQTANSRSNVVGHAAAFRVCTSSLTEAAVALRAVALPSRGTGGVRQPDRHQKTGVADQFLQNDTKPRGLEQDRAETRTSARTPTFAHVGQNISGKFAQVFLKGTKIALDRPTSLPKPEPSAHGNAQSNYQCPANTASSTRVGDCQPSTGPEVHDRVDGPSEVTGPQEHIGAEASSDAERPGVTASNFVATDCEDYILPPLAMRLVAARPVRCNLSSIFEETIGRQTDSQPRFVQAVAPSISREGLVAMSDPAVEGISLPSASLSTQDKSSSNRLATLLRQFDRARPVISAGPQQTQMRTAEVAKEDSKTLPRGESTDPGITLGPIVARQLSSEIETDEPKVGDTRNDMLLASSETSEKDVVSHAGRSKTSEIEAYVASEKVPKDPRITECPAELETIEAKAHKDARDTAILMRSVDKRNPSRSRTPPGHNREVTSPFSDCSDDALAAMLASSTQHSNTLSDPYLPSATFLSDLIQPMSVDCFNPAAVATESTHSTTIKHSPTRRSPPPSRLDLSSAPLDVACCADQTAALLAQHRPIAISKSSAGRSPSPQGLELAQSLLILGDGADRAAVAVGTDLPTSVTNSPACTAETMSLARTPSGHLDPATAILTRIESVAPANSSWKKSSPSHCSGVQHPSTSLVSQGDSAAAVATENTDVSMATSSRKRSASMPHLEMSQPPQSFASRVDPLVVAATKVLGTAAVKSSAKESPSPQRIHLPHASLHLANSGGVSATVTAEDRQMVMAGSPAGETSFPPQADIPQYLLALARQADPASATSAYSQYAYAEKSPAKKSPSRRLLNLPQPSFQITDRSDSAAAVATVDEHVDLETSRPERCVLLSRLAMAQSPPSSCRDSGSAVVAEDLHMTVATSPARECPFPPDSERPQPRQADPCTAAVASSQSEIAAKCPATELASPQRSDLPGRPLHLASHTDTAAVVATEGQDIAEQTTPTEMRGSLPQLDMFQSPLDLAASADPGSTVVAKCQHTFISAAPAEMSLSPACLNLSRASLEVASQPDAAAIVAANDDHADAATSPPKGLPSASCSDFSLPPLNLSCRAPHLDLLGPPVDSVMSSSLPSLSISKASLPRSPVAPRDITRKRESSGVPASRKRAKNVMKDKVLARIDDQLRTAEAIIRPIAMLAAPMTPSTGVSWKERADVSSSGGKFSGGKFSVEPELEAFLEPRQLQVAFRAEEGKDCAKNDVTCGFGDVSPCAEVHKVYSRRKPTGRVHDVPDNSGSGHGERGENVRRESREDGVACADAKPQFRDCTLTEDLEQKLQRKRKLQEQLLQQQLQMQQQVKRRRERLNITKAATAR